MVRRCLALDSFWKMVGPSVKNCVWRSGVRWRDGGVSESETSVHSDFA